MVPLVISEVECSCFDAANSVECFPLSISTLHPSIKPADARAAIILVAVKSSFDSASFAVCFTVFRSETT